MVDTRSTANMTSAGALEHVLGDVLGYPDDHPVRLALNYFGVTDIGAFTLFYGDDFTLPYMIPDPADATKQISTSLVPAFGRRLNATLRWYYQQPQQKLATWYNLTPDSFQTWYDSTILNPPTPDSTLVTPNVTAPPRTFRSSLKINLTDYPTLKDDKHWRTYHRLLKATAASHDTLDVLDTLYVPSIQDTAAFQEKQSFMYHVFTKTLNTSKGKLCVRNHELKRDAQCVYIDLLEAYNDELSSTIIATTLRNELTLLKMDDKWRSGYEHFLSMWNTKILDLESVEDAAIDDNTKRIWLTATLQSNSDMRAAIRQAHTTQLTLSGMNSTAAPPSWSNFYSMLLFNAKVLDKEKAEVSKTQRRVHMTETTRNPGRTSHRGGRSSNTRPGRGHGQRNAGHHTPRQFTKYLGANMPMKVDYIFSRADWPKLTPNQRNTLIALKKSARESGTVNAANVTRQVNTHVTAPASDASVMTDVSGNGIRQLLSNTHISTPAVAPPSSILYQGSTYQRSVNICLITYRINQHQRTTARGSLLDGGANGGVAGNDVLVIETTLEHVDINGLADTTSIPSLAICTVAGLIQTQHGPIIGIFHNYAYHGKGTTVHSINQLKHFGLTVDDTPLSLSGTQSITTPDGYHIPIHIRQGLPWMDMKAPTPSEMDSYPHVIFSSDMPWDPQVYDNEYNIRDLQTPTDLHPPYHPDSLNNFGELTTYAVNMHVTTPRTIAYHRVQPKQHDFVKLQPHFGFVPADRIKHTLANTTQYARMDTRLPLRKHFKTRFPAANVSRLNETVATDTFFSDIPAHDDGILGHGGSTMLQLYCGCSSHLLAVYPMKTDHEMAHTLEDFIRSYGAPNALFSDNARAQIGKAVKEILRMYAIKDFQCEPHHQHQNRAERHIQEVKKRCNILMDRTGTPASYWLLCTNFAVYILNRLSASSLNNKTPLEVATGQQPDISAILAFHWFQPVYFKSTKMSYPSHTQERSGRIVGFAEHQGDALTFLIMDDITHQVLARSELRPLDNIAPNLRTGPAPDNPNFIGGEIPTTKTIMSTSDIAGLDIEPTKLKLPRFSPDELMGQTFIRTDEEGNHYAAKIVRKITDKDAENYKKIQFLVEIGDGKYDEIISYNEISNIIEEQEDIETEEKRWTFTKILEHQGPIKSTHKDYKGSAYNVLVEWDDGSQTYEPLDTMIKDDPLTLAQYAQENDLLETPSWKRLKSITNANPNLKRLINKTKTRPSTPTYQFGIQVPRNVKEALMLDERNGNTKWNDAMQSEIQSLNEYNTFKDNGKLKFLEGYKRIVVHFVFAVKHDFRHKARLVAGGHLTDPTTEGTYSGVVSLRSLRIAIAAAELNELKIMVGDISSAYLEAYTQEKVYFMAGPEFGPLEGNLLTIDRALYGLRTSGAQWHDRLADTLRDMGFFPCKADPDVWLRDCGTHYEYVCVYVDDIMMFGKDPQAFFDDLTHIYHYQLKGVGPPVYHLGGDFFRDPDGIFAWGTSSYVKKMLQNYEIMFKEKPREYHSPMEEKDHPELDLTEELDADGIKRYQSLIGALQWLVTLGRFDIHVGVATMGSFRAAPRQGHLDRLKRIFGYIKKHPGGAIRFRTGVPDHETYTPPIDNSWAQAQYGKGKEELPPDMPTPKGKLMRTTTYADANLMHDLVTGRSMSGILHFINQTPIQWFAKKQNTVETATYGSEFMVARQAVEQIMDLRYTLRMMGIPIDGKSWLFGDNQSVITSSTIPKSTLSKRHNALSYHRVRECIAMGIINLLHVDGKNNPSDVLTKFLPWSNLRPLTEPLLFWQGATMINDNKPIPIIIRGLVNKTPSGLRGVTNLVNPSGVEVVPQLNNQQITGECSDSPDKEQVYLVNPEEVIHAKIHGA